MSEQITHIDIYHRLGKLEQKVDNILEKLSDGQRKMNDLDERVTKLERLKSYALGAAAAVGFLAAMIRDWVM